MAVPQEGDKSVGEILLFPPRTCHLVKSEVVRQSFLRWFVADYGNALIPPVGIKQKSKRVNRLLNISITGRANYSHGFLSSTDWGQRAGGDAPPHHQKEKAFGLGEGGTQATITNKTYYRVTHTA